MINPLRYARCRGGRLAMVAAITAAAALATAQSASAEVPNCTPSGQVAGNYFDGMAAYNQPYNGVSANLLVRYGAVCDSDTSTYNPSTQNLGNFNYSWTMIADTGGNGWLQSGFFRDYGTGINNFAQYYNANYGIVDIVGAVVNPGETHRYWQQRYGDSQGVFHSNVDTTRLINTSNLMDGWAGLSQQFFNETRYKSSDVPGTSTSKTQFTNIQTENYNGVFAPIPSPFLTGYDDNAARWGGPQPTGSTSFNIWTQNFS